MHNCRRCSGLSNASDDDEDVEFDVPPLISPIRGACKNAEELCNRVLTTSNGHVTTAPTVPAVLLSEREREQINRVGYFYLINTNQNNNKTKTKKIHTHAMITPSINVFLNLFPRC